MVDSCVGNSDLFVMTSNFSCAGAFSTLDSTALWRIDTIICTTLKTPLLYHASPPPPPPTNVLEINKPPVGGGFIDDCSIKYRSKVHPIKIRDWGNQTGETLKSSNVAILAASKLAVRRLTKGLFVIMN